MMQMLLRRLLSRLRRRRYEREMEEEMRLHLELQIEQNLASGMAADEAHYAAQRQFGNQTWLKEASREMWSLNSIETLIQDLRYSLRLLWKNPGFALITVLTLALGIGANTAIFSVISATLIRELPYKEGDRLVTLWGKSQNNRQERVDLGNFFDWKEQNKVFSDMAAFTDVRLKLSEEGETEEIPVQRTTGNLFSVLGAEAMLGRTIQPDDAQAGRNFVAVLSHQMWISRYGGDPQIIGRKIKIENSFDLTVIGVMPPHFSWFIRKNSATGEPPQLWWPLPLSDLSRERRGRFAIGVARLKPGVTFEQAEAEMNTIGAHLEREYPNFNRGYGVTVTPLRRELVGEIRPALLALMGAVGFVLLIACANVANLLLARAAARQKEIAVRAALGAGRVRIIRQLLTESVLLSCLGAAAGLAIAFWSIKVLLNFGPPELGDWQNIGLDLTTLAFTFVVALLTGIVFGLAPALSASRLNLVEMLNETGGGRGFRSNDFLRNGLVVAEVALALVLLVGAGLFFRSLIRLQSIDAGFNPRNVLTLRLPLPFRTIGGPSMDKAYNNFFNESLDRLRSLPGVESVGAIDIPPFAGFNKTVSFTIENKLRSPTEDKDKTSLYVTDHNFFRVMKITLKQGRFFDPRETIEAQHVVIVNESFARRYFPNEDPLGRRVLIEFQESWRVQETHMPSQIIGVVGDARYTRIDQEVEPAAYLPIAEAPSSRMTFVIRSKGDAMAIASAAKNAIQSRFPGQPVVGLQTLAQMNAASTAGRKFNTLLLTAFAVLALLLSAIGIYGVMAFTVSQRTQEIGIRLAIGAQPGDVLAMVLKGGIKLTLIGIAVGLPLAAGLTRLTRNLLFGVEATDPATYAVVILGLSFVAAAACFLPARRAANMDPLASLRVE
jgi:putative ABC transport system permease protein